MKKNLREARGSKRIRDGGLTGTTISDSFYFLCPECGEIMQVLDYLDHIYSDETEKVLLEEFIRNKDKMKSLNLKIPKRILGINFKIYCSKCKNTETPRISNVGFQMGKPSNKN